jgi:2-iminoacetate synthase
MAAGAVQELSSFAHWIRQTDAHAAHRLALVEEVERALDGPAEAGRGERERLAQKLERWRYQHLNEHAGALSPRHEDFVDTLDLAAKQLARRGVRSSRRTRHAVHDADLETASMGEALAALDSRTPLEESVRQAARLTRERWSAADPSEPNAAAKRRMLLYAPLYVSSECVNFCRYCGFQYPRQIARKHLTVDEALEQSGVLRARGLRHLLIVAGDFPSRTTTAYYAELIRALASDGIEPAIEVAPQSTESYAELVAAGACGLTLYQETYNRRLYAEHHPRGVKSSYHWRLEAHDRAAEAGMPRLGLGALLGLADPREDLLAMMRHAAYLARRFPGRTLAFSLPRIREAPSDFQIPHPVSDEQLVRLYCALRIAFPSAELVLSTRESAALRNRLAKVCITQMSAGSSTAPGGYVRSQQKIGQQFPVVDHRTPAEIADWLQGEEIRVCWSIEATKSRRC